MRLGPNSVYVPHQFSFQLMLTYFKPDSVYFEPTSVVYHSAVNQDNFAKRLIDLTGTIVIFVFALSWLIPIISLLVYFNSQGPVFFVQVRTGRNGRVFHCYKFRTMYVERHSDFRQAKKDDSRITTIGRWLRKTNLDELPQLLNVLLGDMSLVGPRPHPLPLDAEFWYEIPNYTERYQGRPGITGLAQAKGVRGITDHPLKMKHRVMYDLYYLKHQSLALDITICWWTLMSMLKGDANAW